MNLPYDEEPWAAGRRAIGREKDAARAWLASREGGASRFVRKAAPATRRPPKPLRFAVAAAAVMAVISFGFLLLRPLFHERAIRTRAADDTIQAVFKQARSENGASVPVTYGLGDAAASQLAWSIQRVFCKAALEESLRNGLPGLIQAGLEALRPAGEASTGGPVRTGSRISNLSEMLLRIFQSIKEG